MHELRIEGTIPGAVVLLVVVVGLFVGVRACADNVPHPDPEPTAPHTEVDSIAFDDGSQVDIEWLVRSETPTVMEFVQGYRECQDGYGPIAIGLMPGRETERLEIACGKILEAGNGWSSPAAGIKDVSVAPFAGRHCQLGDVFFSPAGSDRLGMRACLEIDPKLAPGVTGWKPIGYLRVVDWEDE